MVELKYKFFILIIILTYGCDFFTTRNPELPNNNSNIQYLPQTSSDNVISNFIKSINEKNIDYYFNTFISNSKFHNKFYHFFPTIEVKNFAQSYFDNWDETNEKIFMQNIVSKYKNKLIFTVSNSQKNYYVDSSIYQYDYYLEFDSTFKNFPNKFSGFLLLIVNKTNNGEWYITNWYDFAKKNDTISNTISYLKFILSN